jgi:hypothetical protein
MSGSAIPAIIAGIAKLSMYLGVTFTCCCTLQTYVESNLP